jgi:diguanylate cyclase (GGDEF)-like protein
MMLVSTKPLESLGVKAGQLVERVLKDGTVLRFKLGDINGDGHIDNDDIDILDGLVHQTPDGLILLEKLTYEQFQACDINEDGCIDLQDLIELCRDLLSLSLTDELTQLDNRRAFTGKADLRLASANRYRYPLSCLAVDIDHFKTINDTYGHDVGDVVLQHVAAVFRQHCRLSDIVARVGGEEFSILLDHTPIEGAQVAAEKLRARVADLPVVVNGHTLYTTISIGATERQANDTLLSLQKRADEALYNAKSLGRNRVQLYLV